MALISDSDLATYLNQPTIAGTAHAIQAAGLASGIISDYLHNVGVAAGTQTATNLVLDGPARSSNVFLLPGFPIISLTSVSVYNSVTLSWTLLTQGKDYDWNSSGLVSAVRIADASIGWNNWPVFQNSIQVSYTYGTITVPGSVQAVALSIAARVYSNPTGLRSIHIAGYAEDYGVSKVGFLALDPSEISIISRWVDWTVA